MLLFILDILSFITVGLMVIPGWLKFFFESISSLNDLGL